MTLTKQIESKCTTIESRWTRLLIAGVAAAVLGATGCASSGSKAPTEPMDTPSAMSDSQPSQTPDAGKATTQVSLSGPVYFDTDRSELRKDSRLALQASAKAIAQHPEWGELTIEGHCDERGSDEYNLALGEQRASKVKRYLEDLGVEGQRLDTVSYGESKPVARGHDESSWKLNRRSEIEVGIRQAANR